MPSKKIRLKLYADENFPVPSVTYLKSKGISIVHSFDFKLINKPDKIHIHKASNLKRTIITIDRDFLYYSVLTVPDSYGVIVLSAGAINPLHINTICIKSLPYISPRYVRGAFIKVTIDKIVRIKNGKRDETSF